MSRLPEKQRATLILKIYHDLTHEEVAAILGSSVGTVKANLFHALGNLRKMLGGSRRAAPGRREMTMWTHLGRRADGRARRRGRGRGARHVTGCARCARRVDEARGAGPGRRRRRCPSPSRSYWDVLPPARGARPSAEAPAAPSAAALGRAAGRVRRRSLLVPSCPAGRRRASLRPAPMAAAARWSLPAGGRGPALPLLELALAVRRHLRRMLRRRGMRRGLTDEESGDLADALRAQLGPSGGPVMPRTRARAALLSPRGGRRPGATPPEASASGAAAGRGLQDDRRLRRSNLQESLGADRRAVR